MPTSTIFLPDVNVWVALASSRHVHSELCNRWLETAEQVTLAFCRVTQMGLLRLLTNSSVMGQDVLSCQIAWQTYRAMLTDDRILFAPEPSGLEEQWRKFADDDKPSTKLWTDAYLAAFAHTGSMRLVTLDAAFPTLSAEALILTQTG